MRWTLVAIISVILLGSLCSGHSDGVGGCAGCKKVLASLFNKTSAYVQTTNATFFKQRFQDMGLNFTEWEERAQTFFASVYGSDLDFSSVPPLGVDGFLVPYKENDAAYLFLFSFNDGTLPNGTYVENILNYNVVLAGGFPGSALINRAVNGHVVFVRTYNFQILFKPQYLATKNLTGIFGNTLASLGESWNEKWLSSYYGLQRYTYTGGAHLFDKKFILCAPQPSITNFQFNAGYLRLTNRPLLIDLESNPNTNWGIGDASLDEHQYPTFVSSPDEPQTFAGKIMITFPSTFPNGVTNSSCIPSSYWTPYF